MRYTGKKKNCASQINNPSGQIGTIIIFLLLVYFSIFIGKSIVLKSPELVLGLIGGLIIALITLVNTDVALVILIFSMLLSPEIPVAQIPERAVVIRIDDILLAVMFFTWLVKIAINKQLGLLRRTALNIPLFLYLLASVLFTTLAIILGISEAEFSSAFFYILKIIEYIMLYFLVVNNLKDIKQVKRYVFFMFLVCVLVCIYGYGQIQSGAIRVTAPFEGEHPEPNTFAGYLLIMLGLSFGFLIHCQKGILKFLSLALIAFIIPVFLSTLSRGGYIGFLGLYLSLIIFSKKNKLILLAILILGIFIVPQILPFKVTERIRTTFIPGRTMEVFDYEIPLDYSASYRVETWSTTLEKLQGSPLFGYGIVGFGFFVDNQYARVLGELGIIGMIIFLWLIWHIFKNALRIYRDLEDAWLEGLCLGFLAVFISLLIQSFVANTFIIVRIMEPFWFLAAIVIMIPNLIEQKLET